jgi:hypothetical protein
MKSRRHGEGTLEGRPLQVFILLVAESSYRTNLKFIGIEWFLLDVDDSRS